MSASLQYESDIANNLWLIIDSIPVLQYQEDFEL